MTKYEIIYAFAIFTFHSPLLKLVSKGIKKANKDPHHRAESLPNGNRIMHLWKTVGALALQRQR